MSEKPFETELGVMCMIFVIVGAVITALGLSTMREAPVLALGCLIVTPILIAVRRRVLPFASLVALGGLAAAHDDPVVVGGFITLAITPLMLWVLGSPIRDAAPIEGVEQLVEEPAVTETRMYVSDEPPVRTRPIARER